MTIIERIVITLDEKGKKMADLGRHIGVESSTTSNWKRRNTDPPASLIAPICEFLGVSCEYLLTGREHSGNHSKDEDSLLELYCSLPEQAQQDFIGAMRLYRDLHTITLQKKSEEKIALQEKTIDID